MKSFKYLKFHKFLTLVFAILLTGMIIMPSVKADAAGITYTIAFDKNASDATGTLASIKNVAYGSKVTLPANTFKKKGYTFTGWNTEPDGTGTGYKNKGTVQNLTDVNKSTVTLYARWNPTEYKITYKLNGGTNNEENPASYTVNDETITLENPVREGAEFLGWYSDSKYKKAATSVKAGSTENKTFYAKWKVYKYNIKFDGNGSTSGTMSTLKSRKCGTKYTLTDNSFKKKGYTFTGWNTESEGTGDSYENKAKVINLSVENGTTVTLYAQWVPTVYKITYKLNGGINNAENPATYTINDETIILANPVREGAEFLGWYSDSEYKKAVTTVKAGSTGNKTFYAKWKVYKYNIKFDGNGSTSGTMSTLKNRNCGTKYTLTENVYKRKGYTFAGWNTESDGTGASYGNKAKVINLSVENGETVTLYARWIPIEYQITYKLNGGTNSDENPSTYNIEQSVILKAPTKKGYSFGGWYKDSVFTGKISEIQSGSTGTKTFYAKWVACEHTETEKILTEESTCVTPEIYKIVCTGCDKVVEDRFEEEGTINPEAHSYDEGEITTEPTKISEGILTYTCELCGKTKTETIEKLTCENVGHGTTHSVVVVSPSCSQSGSSRSVCNDCGEQVGEPVVIPQLSHEFDDGEITKAPDKTKPGEKTYTCLVCGYTKTEEIAKLTCENVGHGTTHIEIIADSTCDSVGNSRYICDDCGEQVGEDIVIELKEHSYDEGEITSAPSKAAEGIKTYTCKVCGNTKTETISKLTCETAGHGTTTNILISDSTCDRTGLSKDVCDDCGKQVGENIVVPMKAHTYDGGTVTKEPTCGEEGIRTYTCEKCNNKYTEPIAKAASHNWTGSYTITKAATCSETGLKVLKCLDCDKVLSEVKIAKTSHKYSWIVTKEATKDEEGLEEYTCSGCGDVSDTRVIERLPECLHEKKIVEVLEPATCCTYKYVKTSCANCGVVLHERIRQGSSYDENNHIGFTEKITKNATYLETGSKTYTCEGCGYYYEEDIPKLICYHPNKSIYVDPKTSINWYRCDDCKTLLEKTGVISVTCTHRCGTTGVIAKQATETEHGLVNYICDNCEQVVESVVVHSYKAYTIDIGNGKTETIYGWFDEEQATNIINLLNEYRTSKGLNSLNYNSGMQKPTNTRALEVARKAEHERPNGEMFYTAFGITGTNYFYGENLLCSGKDETSDGAISAWKSSEGHNKNMLYESYTSVATSVFHQYVWLENYSRIEPYERTIWIQEFKK